MDGMMANPTRLLSTLLIGNTLINVAAASLGYAITEALVDNYAELISIVVMTLLLLIFGEVAPKRIAMNHAGALVTYYQPVFSILIRLLAPLRLALEMLTAVSRRTVSGHRKILSEEEFMTGIAAGEEEGVLDEEEKNMVDGIIRLEQTQASDVMTPRVDVIGLDVEDPPEKHREKARGVTFRHLPVYRESLDHPVGMLDVPRFLLSETDDVSAIMQPPFFVPETAPLDTLLPMFLAERSRVAIVLDEYGGTAGLITRGDILEEIVEDVDNEYGEAKLTFQPLRENVWLVSGDTSLEDINHELELNLEAEGADRISGWVAAQVERIPRIGDHVEAQGCRVTVQRQRRHRVTLVVVEVLPEPEEAEDDD